MMTGSNLMLITPASMPMRTRPGLDGLGLVVCGYFGVEAAGGGPYGQITVVLIGLNDLRIVNDTLGHATGFVLLVTVARGLHECVGTMGAVAHLGGDESAINVRGLTASTSDRTIRDILAKLKEPITVEGRAIAVRASCGIAQGTVGHPSGNLLLRTDIVKYQTKAPGDGSWTHYTPCMQIAARKWLS